MGLIVDTSVLITAERKRISIEVLLKRLSANVNGQMFLSIVSIVELTHGMHRGKVRRNG